MSRIAVRRIARTSSVSTAGAIVLGLGLGALAGFLLGELAGPAATRTFGRRTPIRGPRRLVATLVAAAQATLDDDVVLRDCQLRVLAVGPGRIELHGWVMDRRSRARAAHLVSDGVRADAIINCLRVRGEDDLETVDDDDTAPDERLA